MSGPYTQKKHVWGEPIAGQGRDKICTRCGGRRHVIGADSECGGVGVPDAIAPTSAEYEPYAEEGN